MKSEVSLKKENYVYGIIQSIHLSKNDFFKNLDEGLIYEMTIYKWITELFHSKVSIKDAIKIVHERRYQIITQTAVPFYIEEKVALNYQRAINNLETYTIYRKLTNSEKDTIKIMVKKLSETNLYSYGDIVNQMLKVIELKDQKERLNN